MKDNRQGIIIWGAGLYGDIAYHYYKKNKNVLCYVDNDLTKQGKTLNGKMIYAPEEVDFREKSVVVAFRYGAEQQAKAIYEKKIVNSVEIFQISEKHVNDFQKKEMACDNTFIVEMSGGLGNQLFQLALVKCLEACGKKVFITIDKCFARLIRKFEVNDAFPKASFLFIDSSAEMDLLKSIYDSNANDKNYIIYKEKTNKGMIKKANTSLLEYDGGIISGMHQTSYFAEKVKDSLYKELCFRENDDKELRVIKEKIETENSVSIHFRFGDYLESQNVDKYGNICTNEYYEKAILYINNHVANPKFYVFSNDIERAKSIEYLSDAIFIEKARFEDYEDWYDMYLMSKCKYNIIANSTFSWWGAWLNRFPDKIVIAPKKWINTYNYLDIYPEGWVEID